MKSNTGKKENIVKLDEHALLPDWNRSRFSTDI